MALATRVLHQARHGFYGWRIVGLMLGPRAAGVGVYIFGNTLFVIPLEQELGIPRTVSSLLFALGALTSGLSAPVSGMLMDQWNWRVAALVACAAVFFLGFPAAWLSRDTPEEMGLLPDGDTPHPGPVPPTSRESSTQEGQSAPPAFAMTGMSASEALRTPNFWMLALSVLFIGGGSVGVQVHFVPIMVWKGVDEVQAGLMLTALAVAGIPLVLVTGWAADRFDRLAVGAMVCISVAVGVLLMNNVSGWPLWLGVLLFAGNMGIWPIAWAVAGQMFGRRAYSTIRGYLMAGQIIITAAIPVLYGMLYDSTTSYTPALWIAMAMWLGGAIVMVTTPRRTYVART